MSFRLQPVEFSWSVILEIFIKICWEISNLVKIRRKCRPLYTHTQVPVYCWQQYELFHSSKTVWNETIATFSRHHLTILYCGQFHLSQQHYMLNSLLRYHGNSGKKNVLQYFVRLALSVMLIEVADYRVANLGFPFRTGSVIFRVLTYTQFSSTTFSVTSVFAIHDPSPGKTIATSQTSRTGD